MRYAVGTLLLLVTSREALSCPFCDQGGLDAARFIVAVFIPFAVAATLVLVAVTRHKKSGPTTDPSRRIFEAEKKR